MNDAVISDMLDQVERLLGYHFGNPSLLVMALSHPSYAFEQDGSRGNERLEFLGDAVLGLVVAKRLYEVHPDWNEGELTRARAGLVNTKALAVRMHELRLSEYIQLGKTERKTGGVTKASILGNCFEAILGAIYLDGGLESAERFVVVCFGEDLHAEMEAPTRDVKTRFQEWAHANGYDSPRYETVSDSGANEDLERYRVNALLEGRIVGSASDRTKRGAERAAALIALAALEETT